MAILETLLCERDADFADKGGNTAPEHNERHDGSFLWEVRANATRHFRGSPASPTAMLWTRPDRPAGRDRAPRAGSRFPRGSMRPLARTGSPASSLYAGRIIALISGLRREPSEKGSDRPSVRKAALIAWTRLSAT